MLSMKLMQSSLPRYIIEKGTHGTLFYIIESGVAEVMVPGQNGEARTVKEFSTGDYFGEQSLLQGGPRTADIVAVSDVSLLTISKSDFLYLLKGTDVIERMLQIASMRSEDTHRIMSSNTRLKHLTEAQKTQLEERLHHLALKKGDVIFEKGKPATEAVLISSGLVKYEGKAKVRFLGMQTVKGVTTVWRNGTKHSSHSGHVD